MLIIVCVKKNIKENNGIIYLTNRDNMRRKYIRLSFLILLFVSCNVQQPEQRKVLVTVGRGELTIDMLNKEIPDFLKSEVTKEQINNFVQQWIETELIYQNALKLGMDLDKDFRYELEKAKKQLLVRKYLDRALMDEVQVTDEEILQYYEENKKNFITINDEIRALQILVATREEANTARQRLNSGEDFVKVAEDISLDFAQKNRVELGFFSRKDVVPEIASRLFRYQVGTITQPIKSDFGWHIFKILEKRPEGFIKELKDVREKIVSRITFKKKTQRYKSLIADLGNKMRVITDENVLKNVINDSTVILEH